MNQGNRSTLNLWLGFLTAALSALAVGALWCLLALRSGLELAWFSLICAVVVALILRAYGYAGKWKGAFFAALCTALACFYSQCLLAISDIADSLGMPLRSVLPKVGIDFALATAGARITKLDFAVFVLGIVLSAAIARFAKR
jgi:hypothetical protein